MPTTQPNKRPLQLRTCEQAGRAVDRHERSIRNWLSEGLLTGYRVRGQRGILVDLTEVEVVARVKYSRYGKAQIVELPARPVIVNDGLGR